ncbi:hypothetical protein EST38_g6914 [Candolleomyces aberdarensis]|uniref:Uncharacterized protein n=1 Tax=Candolleomyces aberdarensis TaxID=2316362 RepID=A0A4Q2DGH5_9AGAR|nr:hypothetical protein EST38_g6914 [Candolleomyces aberdarensis]
MAGIIVNDPYLEACPDFASDVYQVTRQPLVDKGLSDEDAAAILRTSWEASNALAKQRWQQQIDDRAAADAAAATAAKETEERRIATAREESEAVLKEEKRKNRAKYMPIQEGVGMPDRPMVELPYAVMQKFKKAEYVELWYTSDQGILSTVHELGSVQSQTFSMVRGDDGQMSMVPSATLKASKVIVKDEDLSWEDFTASYLRALNAMANSGWPQDRVQMFARFWSGVQLHPWHSTLDPTGCDRRALLIYQAQQRRAWHQHILHNENAPDLSVFKPEALNRAHEEAVRRHRMKVAQETEAKVCHVDVLHPAIY